MRWILLSAMGLLSCGNSGARQSRAVVEADTCVPGKTIGCACPGGVQGTQICRDDGRGFAPCGSCERTVGRDHAPAPTSKASSDPCAHAVVDKKRPVPPAPVSPGASSTPPEWGHLPETSSTVTALAPVAPPMPCEGSYQCRDSGACTNTSFGCRVTSSEDCRRSDRCANAGECTYTVEGYYNRYCYACRDDDCKASKACKLSGACTAREGRCVASSDGDCQGSKACTRHGMCRVFDDHCVAQADADCKRSDACKMFGYCRVAGMTCAR